MMYVIAIGIVFLVAAANKSVIAKSSPSVPSALATSKQVPFYDTENSLSAAPSNTLIPGVAPDTHSNDTIRPGLADNATRIQLWRGSDVPEIISIGTEQRLGWSGSTPLTKLSGAFFEPVRILPYPPVPLPVGPDIAPASSVTTPAPRPITTRATPVGYNFIRQRILS